MSFNFSKLFFQTTVTLLAVLALFGNVLAYADNSELSQSQISDLQSLAKDAQSSDKGIKLKAKDKIVTKINKSNFKKLENIKQESDLKSLTKQEKESYVASQIVVEEKIVAKSLDNAEQKRRGSDKQDRNYDCWYGVVNTEWYSATGARLWRFAIKTYACAEWNYMTYGRVYGVYPEYLPFSGWGYYGVVGASDRCWYGRTDCVFYRQGSMKLCYSWIGCVQQVRPWIEYYARPLNLPDWWRTGGY
ncbi:MAG: hypothetical protein WCK98_01000 [bacterium]